MLKQESFQYTSHSLKLTIHDLTIKICSNMKNTVGVSSELFQNVLELSSRRLSTVPLKSRVTFVFEVKFLQNTPDGSSLSLTSTG